MRRNSDNSWFTCGCYSIILLLNLLFGGVSVNYLLEVFLSKTIPLFWAVVIGIFAGQFTIPVAVIVWVLKLTGVM